MKDAEILRLATECQQKWAARRATETALEAARNAFFAAEEAHGKAGIACEESRRALLVAVHCEPLRGSSPAEPIVLTAKKIQLKTPPVDFDKTDAPKADESVVAKRGRDFI